MLLVYLNDTLVETTNLSIQHIVTKPSICTFQMIEPSIIPSVGQSLVVYRDTTDNKLFSGTLTNVQKIKFAPNELPSYRAYNYICMASSYQKQLDRYLINNSYSDLSCKQIIEDFITNFTDPAIGFTTNNVSTGPTIEKANYTYERVSDAINQLAQISGYEWYVDVDKDIHFYIKETVPAPFNIDETAVTSLINNLSITPDYTQVRNRVFVRGGHYLSNDYTESFVADGQRRAFPLSFKPHDVSSIVVNSVSKTFALDFVNDDDGSFEYFWNYNNASIRCADGGTPEPTPSDGYVISVTYKYEVPILVQCDNTDSQTAIAAIEGGTGIYEGTLKDESIIDRDVAIARGNAEVQAFGDAQINGSFTTLEHGFEVGQYIVLNVDGYEPFDGNYQIKRITIEVFSPDDLRYTVEFATTLYELIDLLRTLLYNQGSITVDEDEIVDVLETINETINVSDGTASTSLVSHPVQYDDGHKYDLFTYS